MESQCQEFILITGTNTCMTSVLHREHSVSEIQGRVFGSGTGSARCPFPTPAGSLRLSSDCHGAAFPCGVEDADPACTGMPAWSENQLPRFNTSNKELLSA